MAALGEDGRNVGKGARWLGGDGFFADAETNGGVRSKREHHVGRIIGTRATVPSGETKHGRGSDFVREYVGKKAVRHFFGVSTRIFGSAVGGDGSRNGFDDGLSVGSKIIEGTTGIQTIAQVFVVLSEQRMNHRQSDAVDGAPSAGVSGERRDGPNSDLAVASGSGQQFPVGISKTME